MEDTSSNKIIILESDKIDEKIIKTENKPYFDPTLVKEISIILPVNNRYKITEQFVNVIELAVYQKKLQNSHFSIDLYKDANK